MPLAELLANGYTVLDLETTGLDPRTDHIIEIGVLNVRGDKVDGPWSTLINPGVPISEEITRITGITQAEVDAKGGSLENALRWLERRTVSTTPLPIVGHNILRFDLPFLWSALARVGDSNLESPHIRHPLVDTAALFKARELDLRPRAGEGWEPFFDRVLEIRAFGVRFNLPFACGAMGVPTEDVTAHRAGGDVVMTHRLLQALAPSF